MSVNHVAPNASGQGKHKFVEMPVQSPDPVTLATEGGLFTKTTSGSSEMFYLRDAVATAYQMTGPLFTGQGGLTRGGTTMLFGGIILKWGVVTITASPQAISFATQCGNNFPTNCFFVMGNVATFSTVPTGIATTGFNHTGIASGTLYFIAIGN